VKVRTDGRLVSDHPRVWARGLSLTDPVHVEIAAVLRRRFQHRDTAGKPDPEGDLSRDLLDYDRAFGLTDQEGVS
jgi:hypothetical protein